MKFQDEYRDPRAASAILRVIHRAVTRPWTIMEVCGGQTHTIVRYGLDELLPRKIELVHGPGCPVCVTPRELVDNALDIAAQPGVIFCSYGDMLRVPGSRGDLFSVKARGGDVRVVYSPLDCLKLARDNPQSTVVFFAVGFETTAPANAMAVAQARRMRIDNFAVLVSHVLVPPAMTAVLSAADNRVQGFLGPGHVCAVMGYSEYEPIADRFAVPIVITGFEPLDLLEGILECVSMLECGDTGVANQYRRAVTREGNLAARRVVEEVFEVTDRQWRGLGLIPNSGYRLTDRYRAFDAEHRFGGNASVDTGPNACISGEILRGVKKPCDCPAFGTLCTPDAPLGATMVSSEGACAAYYHFGRHRPRPSAGIPREVPTHG